MKNSLRRYLTSLAALLWFSIAPGLAQQDHSAHHPEQVKAADMADGEVRKIDKEAKKITLRHGEIKSLNMPPMTMVFQVKDAAMLDRVQAGDKVRFKAEQVSGAYTVTAIEPVK